MISMYVCMPVYMYACMFLNAIYEHVGLPYQQHVDFGFLGVVLQENLTITFEIDLPRSFTISIASSLVW